MAFLRALRTGLGVALCLSAISCGGGGGGGGGASGTSTIPPPPPAPTVNTTSVIVDQGPTVNGSAIGSINTLFTSVTVCVPGSTTSCQTIDHIQVDTGSYGLRLLSSVLTLTLPVQTLSSGASLVECTQFVDGYSWGPVALADLTIAGETAKSLPVQVIGDPRFTNIPTECSSTGGTQEDTVTTFGANGIMGIGPFALDCGDCDTTTNGLYFACATSCTDTTVPDAMQVANPVTLFAADNNGTIIDLPAVAAAGAVTLSGSLIFGIDTQSDNKSGTQTVLTVDGMAELSMTFNGQTLANSFIDSGSNGIFFADSSIVTCTNSQISTFYCPANTLTVGPLSIQGTNGAMVNNLTFSVGNTETIISTAPTDTYSVLPQLAGTLPAGNAGSFDYGLAFFYGKRVAVAVQGSMTSVGTGPYIAF
ncbi:MAG TPA: DUF3443 family protein [Steroidobacteraceae bacterium]|jgi:hypothetical protein|nr:DUF3443 family protein [Steroidobacteraceae bacterium]